MKLSIQFKGLCMFVTRQLNPGGSDQVRVLLPDTTKRDYHRDGSPVVRHHAALLKRVNGKWEEHCMLTGGSIEIRGSARPGSGKGKGLGNVVRVSDHIDCLRPCVGSACGSDQYGPLGQVAADFTLTGGRWSTRDHTKNGRQWKVHPHLRKQPQKARERIAISTHWEGDFDGPVTIQVAGEAPLTFDGNADAEISILNTDDPPLVAVDKTTIETGRTEDEDFKWYYAIVQRTNGLPLNQLPVPHVESTITKSSEQPIVGVDTPTCLECLLDPEAPCPDPDL